MDRIASGAASGIIVGIEVSKVRLHVHALPAGEAFDAAATEALIGQLGPPALALVSVEATGGFGSVVAASIGATSLPVVVVNPAQIDAFALALGKQAQTDPIDAGASPGSQM